MSSSRFLLLSVAALSLGGSTLALGGCPGSLDDPSRFTGLGGGGVGGAVACDVEATFAASCDGSSCHNAMVMAGTIDLVSPGVAARVNGVPADSSCSAQGLLADPANPTGSVIYLVLTEDTCTPFGVMPQNGTPFTQAQLDCVEQWIASLGAGPAGPGAGGGPGSGGMGPAGAGGMGGN